MYSRKEPIIHKNNQGLSLIELIVALLIASVLITAVTMFLMVTTNTYHENNTETQLQKESQIALNSISDLLMEASEYKFFNNISVNGKLIKTLVIKGQESGNICYYAIICDTSSNHLYFDSITETDMMDDANTDTMEKWGIFASKTQVKAAEPKLLANYVHDLLISPSDSVGNANQYVLITLNLTMNSMDYNISGNVTMRNH